MRQLRIVVKINGYKINYYLEKKILYLRLYITVVIYLQPRGRKADKFWDTPL